MVCEEKVLVPSPFLVSWGDVTGMQGQTGKIEIGTWGQERRDCNSRRDGGSECSGFLELLRLEGRGLGLGNGTNT
jgi:hypothetical protein